MRLPLAQTPLTPGEVKRGGQGANLECSKCGHQASPGELEKPKRDI